MATTPIKYRISSVAPKPTADSIKGAPLTSLEIDGNFRSIKDSIDAEGARLDASIATQADRIDDIILNGIGSILARHTATATAGQTVFDLPFTYSPGANNLVVFVNGLLSERGADYTETSGTRVTFNSGLEVGQEVTFLTNVSPAPAAPLYSVAGITSYTLTSNGVLTSFALPVAVLNKDNTQVFVNGIYQEKANYSIAGSTLAFSEAPVAGKVEVVVQSSLAIGENLATQVSYTPAGTGAVATTVQTKLRQSVSVFDFMTPEQIADVQAGTKLVDVTVAMQNAVASGAKRIYVPQGDCAISGALELQSNIEIFGAGYASKITSTGTNKRVFFATNKNFITVRNLFINGNLTGNGSTSAGSNGGDGIFFSGCENILVEGCFFDNIGQSTYVGGANSIELYQSNKAIIRGNTFLSNSKSRTGADIAFGYYCSTVTVTENISYSEHDSFVSGAAVGVTDSDTAYHVVSNNIGLRSAASDARSGILLPYNGKPAFSTIANNVMVNFPANGIYVSAGATAGAGNSAGVTVTGNVVRYCGGTSSMAGISSGIYLSGRGGATCCGNLVVKSGYKSDGTTRTNTVPGIRVTNTSRNISITGNTVSESRGYGIEFYNAGSVVMETITVCENVLFDNVSGGFNISVTNASSIFKDVSIVGNNIKQENNDAHGITITQSGSAIIAGPLHLSGNNIVGVPSSVNYGITTNVAGMTNWGISDNSVKNFTIGINFAAATIADKEVGYNCIVRGNICDTCTYGIGMNIGAGKYAFIYDNTYINCANNVGDPGRIFNAVRLNGNVVQIQKPTPPTDGAWVVGQQVIDSTPVSGTPMGWTCSVAGSPGTWIAMPNYA